jgi:hypothetical protein
LLRITPLRSCRRAPPAPRLLPKHEPAAHGPRTCALRSGCWRKARRTRPRTTPLAATTRSNTPGTRTRARTRGCRHALPAHARPQRARTRRAAAAAAAAPPCACARVCVTTA